MAEPDTLRETHETTTERVNRELHELLEEVRVAIPGAEVLFAFLLGVAFTERFKDLDSFHRGVYFATLLVTAAATALLIAPTAYHRLHFRDGDKERLLFTATRLAIASLVLMTLAVVGVVHLVGGLVYAPMGATIAASGMAAWFGWFWFGLPLTRRRRDDHRDQYGTDVTPSTKNSVPAGISPRP